MLMATMYPSIGASFEDLLAAYPQLFLQAFLGRALPSFGTVEGFMAVEFFSWVPVLFAAFAALAGAGMVAEETDRRTVEFLLAQPVRRGTVVLDKFLVFLVYLLGIVALTALALSAGLVAVGGEHSVRLFLHIFALDYLAAAAYGAAALLISTVSGELCRATSLSLAVMFGSLVMLLVANVSDRFEFLGYLSPLRYAGAAKVWEQGGVAAGDAAVLAWLTVAFLLASIALFERKELAG